MYVCMRPTLDSRRQFGAGSEVTGGNRLGILSVFLLNLLPSHGLSSLGPGTAHISSHDIALLPSRWLTQ